MQVLLTKKQVNQTKDLKTLRRKFGKAGDKIAECLNLLEAVDTLQELLVIPQSLNHRCHELHNNLKNTFSMDLEYPYRLLFRPVDPIPRRKDDGIDYTEVTVVSVKDLHENTHE